MKSHRIPIAARRLESAKLRLPVGRRIVSLAAWLLFVASAGWPTVVSALPSFARQMEMQCIVCHTEFPELTAFGRQFKLSGYTMSAGQSKLPPIAFMVQPSWTHTQKAQAGGAAPGFSANDNYATTQTSVFYAGRLLGPYGDKLLGSDLGNYVDKIGIFLQATYDGVGKTWSWDNTELRYANSGTLFGHSATYGVYANNNPTLEDPWNTTPAFSFPFSGSGLAPTPAAATLIEGGLAQQVAGLGAYAMFDDSLYAGFGAYHTIGAHLQRSLGVDPTGEAQVTGAAPYWRLALQKPLGGGLLEVGTFGMAADTAPGRDGSAGRDQVVDLGFDAQYQVAQGKSDMTAMLSWIHERDRWAANFALGGTSNAADSLDDFKATINYLYDKTYGLTAQYFSSTGGTDALLYGDSANASPNSSGEIVQLDYLPFNKGGGPGFWPRSNVKLALQYVNYNRFDGARLNFDGNGTNAHDNNTLYAEAWIAF